MSWLLEIALSNAVMATVLGLLVLLVSRFCHRPALIHGLWLVVLLKLVTPPVVQVPVGILPASVIVAGTADADVVADISVPVEGAVVMPDAVPTFDEERFNPQESLASDGELDADGLPLIAVEFDEPAVPDETSATVDQNDDMVFADFTDAARFTKRVFAKSELHEKVKIATTPSTWFLMSRTTETQRWIASMTATSQTNNGRLSAGYFPNVRRPEDLHLIVDGS